MDIYTILNICAGVLLAKLTIGIINEGYWFKWQRIRMELNKLQRRRKRQKKEIEVPCKGKERFETNFPLLQNLRRSETTGKYPKPPKGCPFPRFFDPPN